MTIHISVVVSAHSRIIENTLVTIREDFERMEDAFIFRNDLSEWIEARPIPGQPVVDLHPDQATLLAIQLPQILEGRDPNLFSRYYIDPEGDAAMIEKRPYDWTRLESA